MPEQKVHVLSPIPFLPPPVVGLRGLDRKKGEQAGDEDHDDGRGEEPEEEELEEPHGFALVSHLVRPDPQWKSPCMYRPQFGHRCRERSRSAAEWTALRAESFGVGLGTKRPLASRAVGDMAHLPFLFERSAMHDTVCHWFSGSKSLLATCTPYSKNLAADRFLETLLEVETHFTPESAPQVGQDGSLSRRIRSSSFVSSLTCSWTVIR